MSDKLTESMEDYLETIALLIDEEGHAHTKKVAERLGVQMPSVTSVLQQLERMDYITYRPRYPVVLTSKGRHTADRIIRRHQVLHKFFLEILGLPLEEAEATACRVEHSVDDDGVNRFELFTHALSQRSDSRKLQTYLSEAMEFMDNSETKDYITADQLIIGEHAIFREFGRNLTGNERPDLLPGTELTLQKISLDKTRLYFRIKNKLVEIDTPTAENIWVSRNC
ncbi:MAG: metal-dependent transcriptional regulator [Lentisphaeria bacterium]|nr:metal-dependent transcriptional regulator [Lentisphaeria bacterium]